MLRLDPSCATFTSTHVLFLRLCLHAKAYSDALPVIDKYIFHFPGSHTSLSLENRRPACSKHDSSAAFITDSSGLSAKLTHKDHMQYSLYGGMIYMAVKRWSQALHLLDIAVSSPVTSAVSMIMVEAYKKMILVSLLERGKVAPLPTIITSQVGKIYRSLARPYMALAGAFEGGDYAKLRAEVTIGKAIWHAVRPLFFFFLSFLSSFLGPNIYSSGRQSRTCFPGDGQISHVCGFRTGEMLFCLEFGRRGRSNLTSFTICGENGIFCCIRHHVGIGERGSLALSKRCN